MLINPGWGRLPSGARSQVVRGVLLGVADGGQLVPVKVTIRLGREIKCELVVSILVYRLDLDVVQRNDAREGGDSTHELAELVIAARQADLDGQLGIEVPLLPRLGVEQ